MSTVDGRYVMTASDFKIADDLEVCARLAKPISGKIRRICLEMIGRVYCGDFGETDIATCQEMMEWLRPCEEHLPLHSALGMIGVE